MLAPFLSGEPSPGFHTKARLVPAAVALSVAGWPSVIGPLLPAASALGAASLTVTITSSVVPARPRLSVTASVKASVAGAPGAVKVGWAALPLLKVTAGPPVCCQP